MGLSIDDAISWLLSIAEHEGEDIPIYDTDVEAIKMGIDILHKYQKIEQIYQKWNEINDFSYNQAMRKIGEVLEDGN